MSSSDTIMYMIIGCVGFIALIFFSKPLTVILKIIIQAVVGALGMYVVNFILMPFNIYVGVNLLTAFIVGILGIPGFVSLYLLQVFL